MTGCLSSLTGGGATTLQVNSPAAEGSVHGDAGAWVGDIVSDRTDGVTVVYILFINTVGYRIVEFGYTWTAAKETGRTSGTIVLVLAAASVFSFVLSVENIDTLFAVDPVHIGVIMVFNLMVGLLTRRWGCRCTSPRTSRTCRSPTCSGGRRCTTSSSRWRCWSSPTTRRSASTC